MKKYLLNEAIKEVMVNMAVEDEFPLDINSLDIHTIVETAENNLAKDPQYIRQCKIEAAAQYLVDDNVDTIPKQLERLEAAGDEDLDQLIEYVDGVYIWDNLSGVTIKDFFELIT